MNKRLDRSCVRSTFLVALTLLFGLHVFRVFLPTVIWYLGQHINSWQMALYALGTFALALLAPVVRRLLGERGALALAAGGLALVRLAIQLADAPLTDLALATAGLALWGWFLSLWHASPRNRPPACDVPVLAVALPLTFLFDIGSRSLLLSYDLAWRRGLEAAAAVAGLVVLTLLLLWRELVDRSSGGASGESSLGRVWPFLGLGPWLYLTLAITHNPPAWMAATGWSDLPAHLAVNGLAALGAVACALVTGLPARRRWLWALLNGGLLVGALALSSAGIGPGWLWLGLASLTSWAAVGWMLAGTLRPEPLRPGLWRTALATFLALLAMLVIVFLVNEYDLLWMVPVAGAILSLTAACAVRGGAAPVGSARAAVLLLAGVALISFIVVGWGILRWPLLEPVETPPEGQLLRVMTYNIHQGMDADFRMDLEAIANVIAAQNPDVIALNEVNRARATNGFVDTLLFLSRRLRMPYVFGANYADGQYGNAILSRYPVLEWDNAHYVHNTTEVRGLLRVVVDSAAGPITFYATHLDHIGGPENARAEQVAEALVLWNGVPRSILLGDLNAEPHKTELSAIYQAGLVDALAAAEQDEAFTFWDPVPTPSRRIDFIFVTPDLALGRVWVVQTRASDHLPVLAEVGPQR